MALGLNYNTYSLLDEKKAAISCFPCSALKQSSDPQRANTAVFSPSRQSSGSSLFSQLILPGAAPKPEGDAKALNTRSGHGTIWDVPKLPVYPRLRVFFKWSKTWRCGYVTSHKSDHKFPTNVFSTSAPLLDLSSSLKKKKKSWILSYFCRNWSTLRNTDMTYFQAAQCWHVSLLCSPPPYSSASSTIPR